MESGPPLGTVLSRHFFARRTSVLPRAIRRARPVRVAHRVASEPKLHRFARLRRGTLPPRSVSITFDDGFHDFYGFAWPVLRRFSLPATVYLTTYYSRHSEWPVFDLLLRYMLWKSRDLELVLPEVFRRPIVLDERGRTQANAAIQAYCTEQNLSGAERHALLAGVSQQVGFNMADAIRNRLLCLMSSAEVKSVASEGADIQLHTHRHRVFARRERFWQEVDENREEIQRLTGTTASHFCYPGNYRLPEHAGWLRVHGIESAATCEAGLVSKKSDLFLLPRILDSSQMGDEEFDAWICGVRDFFPKRIYPPNPSQLAQEPAPVPEAAAAGA